MEAAQTIKGELDRWIIIVNRVATMGNKRPARCSLRFPLTRVCIFVADDAFSLSTQSSSSLREKIYIIEFERRGYDEFVLVDFKISVFGKILLIDLLRV